MKRNLSNLNAQHVERLRRTQSERDAGEETPGEQSATWIAWLRAHGYTVTVTEMKDLRTAGEEK